jgi:hypothetical protein
MTKRTFPLLLAAGLVTSALWAADDAFVGEWKLNSSKSGKIIDQMKVASVAGNKYALDLGAGITETIALDGTDQPGTRGTTLSITVEAPDAWKVVRKKDGRVLLNGNWKLASDGKTLTDDYTQFGTDGYSSNVKYVYKRTAGTSGFAGTWENTTGEIPVFVLRIQPYEGDGLSFMDSSDGVTRNVKFDGKDYPNVGANVPPGSTSSGRRVNARALEITGKSNGKVGATREIELSSDGKTLTMTLRIPGRTEPIILVFDRQ